MSEALSKALHANELLTKAVRKELIKKARLGRYAIMVVDGEYVRVQGAELAKMLNDTNEPIDQL